MITRTMTAVVRVALWFIDWQRDPQRRLDAIEQIDRIVDQRLAVANDDVHAADCAALGLTPSELAAATE